jgi:hypothetical protein
MKHLLRKFHPTAYKCECMSTQVDRLRSARQLLDSNGEDMTGNKHNFEGNSSDSGEPDPGPYWRRMHRDWRFWVGAVFMAAALAIYVLSGDLAWVPRL